MARSPFRIVLRDASGAIVGTGPILTALNVDDTRSLDRIGSLEFTVPAGEPLARLIGAGTQFDVYDETDGYLGRYFYKTHRIVEESGKAELSVQC